MLFRRPLVRAAPRMRQFSTTVEEATKKAYLEKKAVEDAHANGKCSPEYPVLIFKSVHPLETSDLWRKIRYFPRRYLMLRGLVVCR